MALFGGSKPDHPMVDFKAAKVLVSELPANDFLKALEEVTFWLDSVTRTEGFKVDYRYQLFDLLDQAAKLPQRKASQEYLATGRQEKFRENRLWNTLSEFWKTLGEAYSQCVEQFQAGASGSGGLKKELPAVISRVMRTQTLQLKLAMLRYGPVEDRVWAMLGSMYQFAESRRISTVEMEIYPGAHGTGNVREEFLKAMMLGISSTDGLTPQKQEIAERAIAHFGALYEIREEAGAECHFCFDLAMRKAAARVQKNTERTPTMRYFGSGRALQALRLLVQEIQTQNAIPAEVNLGGSYDVGLVLSVLQHLARYWSDTPPARSSERHKTATRMTVVHGFQDMVRSLAPEQDAISLDFHVQDGRESWIVENVSDGGFGAIVPPVKGDWVKVGSLLAVQTESSKYWGAGVIRRITRDEHQQRRVGIEVLSRTVIPVSLTSAGHVSSFNAARGGDVALLLSTTPDKGGEVAMLLRAGSYSARSGLDMTVRGKQYYLVPGKLAEGGEDFDWAKFRVMQRD